MSRSPYATTSALTVACPVETCRAYVDEECINEDGTYRTRAHSARRKAADAARTAEVNPQLVRDQ